MAEPKKPLRSSLIVEGLDRVPHRAFLRAVGIVSQHGENTPCSMSLGPQADAARLGVAAGQGIAVPFTTISVSDGVSMNHRGMRMSLVSRELIADSIEAVVRAHCYDALVGFAGCDKTLPGVMMAMARLNCPSVFVYGGAMLPGSWRGRDVTILTAYEGVGAVLNGTMTEAELDELGHDCAPTLGSCPGQFTANTMAMVAETLGLALPGSAMMPAAYSQRLALARKAGQRATELVRSGGPLPRELITRKSLENATAAVAATGGSTNAGLHLPAIAHEAGIRFTLDDVAEVFARVTLAEAPRHTIYSTGGHSISLGDLAEMVKGFLPDARIAFEQNTGGRERSGNFLIDNRRLVEEFSMQYPPFRQRVRQIIDEVRAEAGLPPLRD